MRASDWTRTRSRDSGRNPRQPRLGAGVAIFAAALVACTSAAAAAPPKRPAPEQLWKVYPLNPKPAETHAVTTVEQAPAAEAHTATTVEQASPAPRTARRQTVQPAGAPQPDRKRSGAPPAVVAAATAGALALVLVIAALVFVVNGSDASTQRPRRRGVRRHRGADPFASPLRAVDGGEPPDPPDPPEPLTMPDSVESTSEVDVLRAKLPGHAAAAKSEHDVEADVDVLKAKREQRDRETQKTDTTPDLDTLKAKRAVESPPKVETSPAEVIEADVLRAKREETPTDTVDALIAKLNPEPDAAPPAKPVLRAVSDQPAALLPRRPIRGGGSIERCAVHWWRGYVKSEFYATTEDDGQARPIATSPAFRWRKSETPPDRGAATRALAALVEQLEADGWRAAGRGNDWYALRFRRRAGREGGDTDTSN